MYKTVETVQRIKNIAREKGVKISDMLSYCGLSKNALASMRAGSWTSAESMAKIADYLGVSVDYLLGRSKEKVSQNIIIGGDNGSFSPIACDINCAPADELSAELLEIFSELTTRQKVEVMAYALSMKS